MKICRFDRFQVSDILQSDQIFDILLFTGSIVFLTARVNRAFNTSMEVGVIVESETANGGERVHVCRVFATFVEVI